MHGTIVILEEASGSITNHRSTCESLYQKRVRPDLTFQSTSGTNEEAKPPSEYRVSEYFASWIPCLLPPRVLPPQLLETLHHARILDRAQAWPEVRPDHDLSNGNLYFPSAAGRLPGPLSAMLLLPHMRRPGTRYVLGHHKES